MLVLSWVDLIILVILLFFIIEGLGKSFLTESLDFFSFLFAFLFSLKFYNLIAKQAEAIFSLPHSLANVLGFIALWYFLEIIFFFFARPLAFRLNQKNFLNNRFLSVIPAFLKGVIFVAVILILAATFPIHPQIKNDVQGSKLGSAILIRTYQIEAPLKSVFGGLANDTLTFFTIKPKSNERLDLGFQTFQFTFNEDIEHQMLDLVNKERAKIGVAPLQFDSKLREVARNHSSDMFKRGYFAHYTPEGKSVADRALVLSVDFMVIGENLAYAPSLNLAHQGLMNSPGHKANILSSDFKKIGVGTADGGSFGLMFTQVFTD